MTARADRAGKPDRREGQALRPRAIDLLLLLAILPGGLLAWQTGRERGRLEARYERMVKIAGDLPIADPTKVYIRALDTGEPLHYAWRVYLPPNYTLIVRNRAGNGNGGSSTSWSLNSVEFIARVGFRKDEQGLMNVYTRFHNGSSMSGFGGRAVTELLTAHPGEVRVEQLGSSGIAVVQPDQSAVLLRMSLPEELVGEAHKGQSPRGLKADPLLFELEFGPRPGQ
jgi:hypothetical protein